MVMMFVVQVMVHCSDDGGSNGDPGDNKWCMLRDDSIDNGVDNDGDMIESGEDHSYDDGTGDDDDVYSAFNELMMVMMIAV